MKLNRITQFAIAYAKHGWWVVKVPLRKKKPIGDDWEKQRLGSREIIRTFNVDVGMNIGIILGASGIVDIDLDCEEARRLAGYLLPPTGMRFGRNAAPNSHWIYTAQLNGERTKQYEGPGQDMICELRCGIGSQTVFPPGVHESGDVIGFESKDDPAHVDVAKLRDVAGEVAAASLLLRHYPNQGSRHRYAMAIAGGLLRANWRLERAERFIEAVVTEAGDEETGDRVAAVRTTHRAISEGREVIGWPCVGEIIDGSEPCQQYVNRIRRHLGIDRRQAIVVRAEVSAPPIDLETASTEPYRAGESRRAVDRMAETSRQLRRMGNDLAVEVSIWLDRKGPETLDGIDYPIPYAAKAIGVSRGHFHKLGQIGRVVRVSRACDTPLALSDRAILPLARLLPEHPEAILEAVKCAGEITKAEARSKSLDKPKPVNKRHMTAAVDRIIGAAEEPSRVVRRRLSPDPDTAAAKEFLFHLSKAIDIAAITTVIPHDVRTMIAELAKHKWCRQ